MKVALLVVVLSLLALSVIATQRDAIREGKARLALQRKAAKQVLEHETFATTLGKGHCADATKVCCQTGVCTLPTKAKERAHCPIAGCVAAGPVKCSKMAGYPVKCCALNNSPTQGGLGYWDCRDLFEAGS